jgi:hypothetical protein
VKVVRRFVMRKVIAGKNATLIVVVVAQLVILIQLFLTLAMLGKLVKVEEDGADQSHRVNAPDVV